MLHKTANGSMSGGAEFEIALIPGSYDFLFWADYGNGHYITTNLREVAVTTDSYCPGAQNDAFACALKQMEWEYRIQRHLETPRSSDEYPQHLNLRSIEYGFDDL